MGLLRDEMNATLGSLAVTLDDLVDDLNGLAADLLSLNDVVMGANNFTKWVHVLFYITLVCDAAFVCHIMVWACSRRTDIRDSCATVFLTL